MREARMLLDGLYLGGEGLRKYSVQDVRSGTSDGKSGMLMEDLFVLNVGGNRTTYNPGFHRLIGRASSLSLPNA